MATVIQIDGKISYVLPEGIHPIRAVVVPGKLINLITKESNPDDLICFEETDGEKKVTFGKNVSQEVKDTFK